MTPEPVDGGVPPAVAATTSNIPVVASTTKNVFAPCVTKSPRAGCEAPEVNVKSVPYFQVQPEHLIQMLQEQFDLT